MGQNNLPITARCQRALLLSSVAESAVISRRFRRIRGAVTVEVSVSAAVLLFIVFAFCSFAIHLYHQVGLQYAVNQVARTASIGEVAFGGGGNRVENIDELTLTQVRSKLVTMARKYGVSLRESDIGLELVCGDAPGCAVGELGEIPLTGVFRVYARGPSTNVFGLVRLPLYAESLSFSELS